MRSRDAMQFNVGDRIRVTAISPMDIMHYDEVERSNAIGTITEIRADDWVGWGSARADIAPLRVLFDPGQGTGIPAREWWVQEWERVDTPDPLIAFKAKLLETLLREAEQQYSYEKGTFDPVLVKAGYTQDEIEEMRAKIHAFTVRLTAELTASDWELMRATLRSMQDVPNGLVNVNLTSWQPVLQNAGPDSDEEVAF